MKVSKPTLPFNSIYFDKRVLSVFLMGVSQGLPWVMIGSSLTIWLKETGISRTDIGFAGLIFGVYSVNFFWSPLVDQLRLPLQGRLGQRKSWILACQLIICLSCLLMALGDPASSAKSLVLTALVLASFSATQDISIDAYRIDSFGKHEGKHISAAAAAATAGWWTGYAGIGYIPLMLSDNNWAWPELYILLACCMAAVIAVTFILPQPQYGSSTARQDNFNRSLHKVLRTPPARRKRLLTLISLPMLLVFWAIIGSPGLGEALRGHAAYPLEVALIVVLLAIAVGYQVHGLERDPGILAASEPGRTDKLLAWLLSAVVAPIRDFLTRNPVKLALAILGFVFLFKVGEAFLGRMSIVFYKEVGFSNTDIAKYSKMLTWWLTIIFALLGGLVNARFGIVKGLIISGLAMAGSNLMFAWIAAVGPNINLFIATIVVDGFAQAWSTVAFVSFISMLCSHTFSATQYALLASLASLGRTTLSSASGLVVDLLDGNWSLFFILTTVMVIPSLLLLLSIHKPVSDIEKNYSDEGADRGREN